MTSRSSLFAFALAFVPTFALAQAPAPPPPPKVWTETASVGLALTSGNKDTSTLNAGYEIVYDPRNGDPQRKNLVKSDGLFLRGKTDGELTAERLVLNARDEYRFHDGFFAFGQTQYLSDRFKEIDYLVAPTTGLGYRLVDTPATRITVDTGAGWVWEKNTGGDLTTSGAVTYSEKLSQQISSTTSFTQTISAIHKMNDFSDALYQFGAAVSAAVTPRTQLKVELQDVYKNRPPDVSVQKNDVALIVALVFKN